MITVTTLKELIENIEQVKHYFPEQYDEMLKGELRLFHKTRQHADSEYIGVHTATGQVVATLRMEDVKPT